MQQGIHPKYKDLKIKIGTDIFHTMSASHQDEILMDIDYRKHPAWTKKGIHTANASDQNVSAFNQRFAGLTFGLKN